MPPEDRAPYRLSLLGPWTLHGSDGRAVRSVLAQPKRLCLLAYLALSGGPVSRSALVALFWPDSDEERARNALSQSLHYLRRSLGPGVVESVEGDRVRVAPEQVWVDARELLGWDADVGPADSEAAGARVVEMAEEVRGGHDFFQGWNADDSQPLQSWLDGVRRRVRERAEAVVRVAGETARAPEESGRAAEEAEDERTGPTGERFSQWPRTTWIGGGAVVGILLTTLVFVIRTGSADPPSTTAPSMGPDGAAEIALLLPRVTALGPEPSLPSGALAEAIHDEMIVQLEAVEGARVISVKFESEVAELVRSLEAQGAIDPAQGRIDPPRWVVSVSVRTGGGQARVIALLLRGPDYTIPGAVSEHDYAMPSTEVALIELPKRIAADVVEGLGGVGWVVRPRNP